MRNFEMTTAAAAAAELDPLSEQPLVSVHDDASDSSLASSCVDTRGCYEMEDKHQELISTQAEKNVKPWWSLKMHP